MSATPAQPTAKRPAPPKELWRVHAGGIAACLAITAAMYFIAVGPLLRHRQHLRDQRLLLEEEQAVAGQLTASLNRFRSELEAVKLGITEHPLQLKTADQINHQLAKLTDVARRCGLELNEIQPATAPKHKEHYDTLSIKVVGAGTFRTFVLFLRTLHEEMPDIGVGLFEVAGTPTSNSAEFKFSTDLDWYMLPSGTPASPSAATASVPAR